MSAFQSHPDHEKRSDRASLIRMLSYMEAEARALGVEDAARHIASGAWTYGGPVVPVAPAD